MKPPTARLLITCADRRGIIAAVTGFLAEHGFNMLDVDQHTDPDEAFFCMRLEFEMEMGELGQATWPSAWDDLATRFQMNWRLAWSQQRKRIAILVSRMDHCLHDLLLRQRCNEIQADIAFIASNHADLRPQVEAYGLPYHELPVTPRNKPEQEKKLLELCAAENVDLIVLARYMQILSPQVIAPYRERIINIHHSFLPAFAGAKPYHQAYQRGVKVVGATAHYVTEALDAGPIIAQDTINIDHRDTVGDLVRKGRDLERTVLATAVRLHVEDKLQVNQNRVIVFD